MRRFSMEDEATENEVVEISPEEEIEMVAEEAEVEAEADDIIEDVDSVDEASEAAEEVEEIAETIGETLEEDGEGLDPVAAEAIRNHLASIGRRVGYDTTQFTALYSEESFATDSARRANTEVSFESISEFARNLWAKIWAFLKNAWDKLQALMSKILPGLTNLRKALEQLLRKVESTKGAPPSENVALPNSLAAVARTFSDSTPAGVVKHFNAMAKGYDDAKGLIAEQDTTIKAVAKGFSDKPEDLKVEVTDTGGKVNLTTMGQNAIMVSTRTLKINDSTEVQVISGFVADAESVGAGSGDAVSTPVADKATLKGVCKTAIEVLKRAEEISKLSSDYSKTMKQTGNKIDGLLSRSEKKEGGSASKAVETLSRNYRDSASGVARISTRMVANAKSAGTWSVRYVNFCLKQYAEA